MTDWDERFRTGSYPREPTPDPLLVGYAREHAPGRALDLATGTGRNAVVLAELGYEVDALDRSREGLRIVRERAREEGVGHRVDAVQADAGTHGFPTDEYDLVAVSHYRAVDRFPDLFDALAPGGLFFCEHHLRSSDDAVYDAGPSGDRYRFGANELLHACLDLTVLAFDARTERRTDGERAARTRVLARNSTGRAQSYPRGGLERGDREGTTARRGASEPRPESERELERESTE